jgi:hypothetical protein
VILAQDLVFIQPKVDVGLIVGGGVEGSVGADV